MRRCGSEAPPPTGCQGLRSGAQPWGWLLPGQPVQVRQALLPSCSRPHTHPLPYIPPPPHRVKPGSKAPIWALARGWLDCDGRGASWERKLWGWGGGCGKSFEGRRPGMGTPGAGRRPLEPGWAGDERGMSTRLPPPSRMSWREPELQPVSLSHVSPVAV